MSDKNFKVKSGLQVPSLTTAGPVVTDSSGNVTSSATLPISQGGTGQTTAGNALNAILPLQTSNDNKYLQTNGVSTQWNTVLQPVYADNAPSSPQVGQVWIESDSSSDSFDPNIIRRKSFTATAAQTVFTTDLEFIQGYEQVFFNGLLLLRGSDYTTASNTNVTLTSGAAVGDIVEIVSITNLNSINAATTTANTFTGNQQTSAPYGFISNGNGGSFTQISGNSVDGALIKLNRGGQANQNAFISQYQGNLYIKNLDSAATIFTNTTSDVERLRITPTGDIGIGTSSPGEKLEMVGGNVSLRTLGSTSEVRKFSRKDDNLTTDLANISMFGAGPNNFNGAITFNIKNGGFYDSPLVQAMIIDSNANINLGGSSGVDTLRYLDIQNTNSGNSAGTIIRMITNNAANTGVATVDIVKYRNGYLGINNNDSSATIGFGTSGTERMRIGSTGNVVIGSTNAGSHKLYVEDSQLIDTTRVWNTNANFAQHIYQGLATRANSSAYYFYSAFSSGGGDAEFYVRGDGQVNTDLSFTGGGADYAEYFEWEDGNINNEDRRGYSVSLVNNKIKIAEEGDSVIGVVSGNPSVVGDDAPMKWSGKYLKDDFGSYTRDEDGYRILNPEYDEEAEYISREDRSEWSTIGLMGKLRLRKGQLVGAGWIKMRDISETVEEWLVK